MLDHRPRAHELNGAHLDTYQPSVTAGDEYRPKFREEAVRGIVYRRNA
jgi:hypothetical protein